MKQISWVIIGCGDVTEVKSGPAFYQLPHTRLSAVMRRNIDKACDYARRHHVPKAFDNPQQLLSEPGVDAVYIATPPSSHCQYAIMAAQKGMAVYVEKPMAMNYRECQMMIATAAMHHTPLFVAYYRREMPYFKKVKELLDQHIIGTITAVETQYKRAPLAADLTSEKPWRLQKEHSAGGYLVDMGSHQIDLYLYLLGDLHLSTEPIVENRAGLYEVEDFVSATFSLKDNKTEIKATWDFCATEAIDYTEIRGTEGKIRFSCFDMRQIEVTMYSGSKQIIEVPPLKTVQQPMIEWVSTMLLNSKGTSAEVIKRTQEAARVSQIIEEILTLYYQ